MCNNIRYSFLRCRSALIKHEADDENAEINNTAKRSAAAYSCTVTVYRCSACHNVMHLSSISSNYSRHNVLIKNYLVTLTILHACRFNFT